MSLHRMYSFLLRIYSLLLRLYPPEYRALFGAEMSAVLDMAAADRRRQGWIAAAHFFLVEITGLLQGAAREWIAKLAYSVSHSVSYIDGRGLPDPLLMRPPGVSWFQQHRWRERGAAAGQEDDGRPASSWYGEATDGQFSHRQATCMNAYQTFVLASPIRRLVMLIVGSRECRHCS